MARPVNAMTKSEPTAIPSSLRISVLINNFNYAHYLKACIDSVLDQDYPNFEVVVVDDGSTDNSREVMSAYNDRIRCVLKPNGGQASSFNAGFANASGEVLCLLDADDAFLPGKLRELGKIFSDPSVGWCFDRVTTDENEVMADRIITTVADKRKAVASGKFPSIPVPTSGLSFRKAVLSQILPMRETSDVVLSDNYLKFAAAYLAPGIVVETPMTFQRIHSSNRYTGAGREGRLKPHIMIATGAELALRFPGMMPLGRELVAGGVALSRQPLHTLPAHALNTLANIPQLAESRSRFLARVLAKRLIQLINNR